MMKRLFSFLLAAVGFAAAAPAADVLWYQTYFDARAITNRRVDVKLLSAATNSGTMVSVDGLSYRTDATGFFGLTNICGGIYRFELFGTRTNTTYDLAVPTAATTYRADLLALKPNQVPGWVVLLLSTNVWPVAGTNVNMQTNGLAVTVNANVGYAATVSNAQWAAQATHATNADYVTTATLTNSISGTAADWSGSNALRLALIATNDAITLAYPAADVVVSNGLSGRLDATNTALTTTIQNATNGVMAAATNSAKTYSDAATNSLNTTLRTYADNATNGLNTSLGLLISVKANTNAPTVWTPTIVGVTTIDPGTANWRIWKDPSSHSLLFSNYNGGVFDFGYHGTLGGYFAGTFEGNGYLLTNLNTLVSSNATPARMVKSDGSAILSAANSGIVTLSSNLVVAGTYTGNGSGLTNLSGVVGSLGEVGRGQLWVSTAGNDATGSRTNPALPFLTMAGAEAAAIAGDVIYVTAGTHAAQNLGTNAVVWELLPGATVGSAGVTAWAVRAALTIEGGGDIAGNIIVGTIASTIPISCGAFAGTLSATNYTGRCDLSLRSSNAGAWVSGTGGAPVVWFVDGSRAKTDPGGTGVTLKGVLHVDASL